MKMSDQGLELLSQREGGFVLKPYQDSKGIWTDGLGNTHGVVPYGPPIPLDKAKSDFAHNLAWVEAAIDSWVKVPLHQYEHDALGSFIFNVGAPQFHTSHILQFVNAGQMAAAAAAFDNWHIPPEITSRRNGEREQFKGTRFEARIVDERQAA